MRSSALTLLAAVMALPAGLVACDNGDGELFGDWLEVPDCHGANEPRRFEPFELVFDFAGLVRAEEVVSIRLAPSPRVNPPKNMMVITVNDWTEIHEEVEAEGQALRTLDRFGVFASLALLESCPRSRTPLHGEGEITFFEFGPRGGDPVHIEWAFDVVDGRTGQLLGERFVGEARFDVTQGTPYEWFLDPTFDDEFDDHL